MPTLYHDRIARMNNLAKTAARFALASVVAGIATRYAKAFFTGAKKMAQAAPPAEEAVAISYPTMFGKASIYTIRQDEHTGAESRATDQAQEGLTWIRVLEIDGAYQAATYIDDDRVYDLAFDYYRMYDHLFEMTGTSREINLLMLGGGGYAYPKHIVAHHPEARIDVVEIDPDITLLAERYFFLDRLIEEFDTEKNGRLGLINDDALHFLKTSDAHYDAILNDTFAGKNPVGELVTVEALRLSKKHLAPGGVYLANVISALEGPKSAPLQHAIAALSEVFEHVSVIPCGKYPANETDNYMVIATDSDLANR